MILGLVPILEIKVEKGKHYGDMVILLVERNRCGNPKIMRLRVDSLMMEGAKLYNCDVFGSSFAQIPRLQKGHANT